jgi:cytochrome b
MVMGLLVVVMITALTGMMVDHHGYIGPLAHFAGGIFGYAHGGIGSFIMVLVGVHMFGVVAHSVISRENLMRSMITGLKTVPSGASHANIKPVGFVRPLIAVAAALAVAIYFIRL